MTFEYFEVDGVRCNQGTEPPLSPGRCPGVAVVYGYAVCEHEHIQDTSMCEHHKNCDLQWACPDCYFHDGSIVYVRVVFESEVA